MIDHENWKITVKLSTSVYDTIISDINRISYFKSNGDPNLNGFINNIISLIFKRKMSIFNKLTLKYKNIDFKTFETFNTLNYENYFGSFDEKITVRISKKNIRLFDGIIGDYNKSSFIRTLIHQYVFLPVDQRQYLLFSDTYKSILKAMKDRKYIRFKICGVDKELIPVDISFFNKFNDIMITFANSKNCYFYSLVDISNIKESNKDNDIDYNTYFSEGDENHRYKEFTYNGVYYDFSSNNIVDDF